MLNSNQYTYDAELVLKEEGAVTVTGAESVVLDVGSGQCRGDIIFDVTGIDTANSDEAYLIFVQGVPDGASFADASQIEDFQSITLGAMASKVTDSDVTDGPGRYILPFTNERNGKVMRHIRLFNVVVGTTASITYSARIGKDR